MPGECVGLDEMSDGTYLVTCHGKTAMAGRGGAVLGGALTETMMLFSGESSREIRKEEKKRVTEAHLFFNNQKVRLCKQNATGFVLCVRGSLCGLYPFTDYGQ
jgi:hypothetical protein